MFRFFVSICFFFSFHGALVAQSVVSSDIPWVQIPQNFSNGDAWELQLIPTQDELYVSIGLVKPDGEGPFPLILIGSGQGRAGIKKIQDEMERSHGLMMRLSSRGYASAFINFRNEVPELYNEVEGSALIFDNVSGGNRTLRSRASLDSDDFISTIDHARKLSYINPDAIGAIGSSHSGEIIMKAVSDSSLLAAAVPSEAAVREYLLINDADAPRDESGTELQLQDVNYVESLANRDRAMERINRINTPLLVMGRDTDHLQGVFQLLFKWSQEAEKDVQWLSYDHHEHGYALLRNLSDGTFAPDNIQEIAYAEYMAFFDQHLKQY
jgi:dienelactone hydrolase